MSEEITRNIPNDDLSRILALLNSMSERLAALEDKVDRRLQETRPIWEQVLARLESLDNRMGNLEGRMGNLEGRMENLEVEMRAGFRRLERQMGTLAKDVIEVRTAQHDLERRMDKLEDKLESEPTR